MISLPKGKNNNFRPRLIFRITQDEKEIIEKINSLFNTPKITVYKDRNTYVSSISSKKGRERLIKYCLAYPLKTRKSLAFSK